MCKQLELYVLTQPKQARRRAERMSVRRNLTMSKTENALVAASFYAFFKKLLRDSEVSLLIARSFFSHSAPYHLC